MNLSLGLRSLKYVKRRWRQLWWKGVFGADDVRSPITRDDVSLPAIPRIGDDQQTPWLPPFSPSRRSGCGWGMCPNLGPFIRGSRSHSSQSWLRCPDSVTPPSPSLPLPDKIWMSESRNTNKSHCPPLCPWITGFLLHIFGDFISKAVWISLVGEISPIWPGACSASLIPDRAPLHWAHMSTLIRYSMQEKIYKSDYRSHCDVKLKLIEGEVCHNLSGGVSPE